MRKLLQSKTVYFSLLVVALLLLLANSLFLFDLLHDNILSWQTKRISSNSVKQSWSEIKTISFNDALTWDKMKKTFSNVCSVYIKSKFVTRDFNWLQFEESLDIIVELESLVMSQVFDIGNVSSYTFTSHKDQKERT